MTGPHMLTELAPVSYTINGKTLQGLALGAEEAPIVLCLHGWLDNAASFKPLLKALANNGSAQLNKRFIALDWPGHGLSDHRSLDAHYHFFDYVYDLQQVIAHNGWQVVDIIAHSMGGMIASAFSAAFPDKVNSLVLIDTLGFISAEPKQATQQLQQGLLSRAKLSQSHTQKQLKQKAPRSFSLDTAIKARMQVSDLGYVNAKLIVQRSLRQLHEQSGFCWRSDPRVRTLSPYRMTLAQAKQLVADIKCSVLLLHGDKGMDMVAKASKDYGTLIECFTEVELSGGHHVHMEQSQQVVEELIKFWQLK